MKKIAVLGFGCIGSGVCKLLTDESSGFSGRLKYICDLRDIPGRPYKEMHIKDFDVILNDPEVAVVAELTGARRAAYELSKKAMEAGKSVVTSNKEVVAAYGPELLRIAAENNVSYLFEAGGKAYGITGTGVLAEYLPETNKSQKVADIRAAFAAAAKDGANADMKQDLTELSGSWMP